MTTALRRQCAQLYVSGRIVVLVGELSFVTSEVHRRDGGVHGLRRHGRLKERRTDFDIGCMFSGVTAAWWAAQ